MNRSLRLADIFGYLTHEEVTALAFIVCQTLHTHLPVCVNVGAGAGTSSMVIVEANPQAVVYSVDFSPGGPNGGLENERKAFTRYRLDLPNQILGKSHDVAREWAFGQIDLVFIDDEHTEEFIRGDILGWLPHVRHNGVMAFHDYGSEYWPDVKRVVDEMMTPPHMLMLHMGSIVAYRIKKP